MKSGLSGGRFKSAVPAALAVLAAIACGNATAHVGGYGRGYTLPRDNTKLPLAGGTLSGALYIVQDGDTIALDAGTVLNLLRLSVGGSVKFAVDSTGLISGAGATLTGAQYIVQDGDTITLDAGTTLNLLSLAVGGAVKFAVDSSGNVTANRIIAGPTGIFTDGDDSVWVSAGDSLRMFRASANDSVIFAFDSTGLAEIRTPTALGIVPGTIGLLLNNRVQSDAITTVQMPPRLWLRGHGWDTGGGGAGDNTVDWFGDVLPVSGATVSSTFRLKHSLAGAAETIPFSLTSGGALTTAGGITATTGNITASGGDVVSSTGNIYVGTTGIIKANYFKSVGDEKMLEDGGSNLILAEGFSAGVACRSGTGLVVGGTSGSLTTAGAPGLLAEVASATNPTVIPSADDYDTGLGHGAADQANIIIGGVEGIQVNTKFIYHKVATQYAYEAVTPVNNAPVALDSSKTYAFVTTELLSGVDDDTVTVASLLSTKAGTERTVMVVTAGDVGDSLYVVPEAKAGYNSVALGLNGAVTLTWTGTAWMIKSHHNGVEY